MKHFASLGRLNAIPPKAADLDGVFQFLFDVIDLLGGIQNLFTTKQIIADGGTVE